MTKGDGLTSRVLGFMRGWAVKAFPDRLFIDVPEITWGLIALTTAMAFLIDRSHPHFYTQPSSPLQFAFLLCRMAEILPLVIYSSTRDNMRSNMSTPT